MKLIFTVAVKRDLRAPYPLSSQDGAALLWATQLLTERALLAARDWPGGSRHLKLRLSSIKGGNNQRTIDSLTRARLESTWVPWGLLEEPVKILSTAELDGLQLADQVCGAFGAGEILNYGIKETSPFVTTLPWWGTLG